MHLKLHASTSYRLERLESMVLVCVAAPCVQRIRVVSAVDSDRRWCMLTPGHSPPTHNPPAFLLPLEFNTSTHTRTHSLSLTVPLSIPPLAPSISNTPGVWPAWWKSRQDLRAPSRTARCPAFLGGCATASQPQLQQQFPLSDWVNPDSRSKSSTSQIFKY
jgi:hypothetical protein